MKYPGFNYTIPKLIRELKPNPASTSVVADYTIPKLIRELKPFSWVAVASFYYTIPKLIRELKHVPPSWHCS